MCVGIYYGYSHKAISLMSKNVVWRPQAGPQKALVDCPLTEVFFGGARGGGKTDGVLGKWALKEARYGKHFNASMFRKTTTSSEDAIERSREIYEPLGAKFNASKLVWRMPHGGRVSFRYLENIKDAENQQGKNLTDAWVEELGQHADPAPIDMLYGALRSSEVPIQLIGTGNPGGPGQAWISGRYKLIPLPQIPNIVTRTLPDGHVHKMAVIPSRLTDNKILLSGDPTYISRLHLTGSKQLVQAWLKGDWNAVDGAYFDCWSDKMVIKPFPIPQHWTRFRSYDWGMASPFSVGWWAVSDGSIAGIPRGAIVRYKEFYGGLGVKGLRMDNETQAKEIIKRDHKDEKFAYSVADPSIFSENREGHRNGPTIAQDFAKHGVFFIKGKNSRIHGWSQMRLRMTGNCGMPMIFCFDTCVDSIRTIPTLPHSLSSPEDIDTDSEDHVADEWRYASMSRPWVADAPLTPETNDKWAKIFDEEDGGDSWRV